MMTTQPSTLLVLAGLLWGGTGCALRQPASAPGPSAAANRTAFSITLHCEPEDALADWEDGERAAVERERLYGTAVPSGLGTGSEQEDCGLLIEAIREGSESLLYEARYDRVRHRQ